MSSSNIAPRANADLLEEKYLQWKENPHSVEATWSAFFEGFELGQSQSTPGPDGSVSFDSEGGLDLATRARIVTLVYTFRSLGHKAAWLDPLEGAPDPPELSLESLGFREEHLDEIVSTQFFEDGRQMTLRDLIQRMRQIYCGKLGIEYMYILSEQMRTWIRERVETRVDLPSPPPEKKLSALTWLEEAEEFERFLHRKYVGQKRFSLEGGESLMVALNSIFERCPEAGVKEISMGMAHRGRLNVLANFLHKPLRV
ncbi:MAG: 2-oxoglutarate dehydrogenase E1 component, partial [Verrucomicrobiae bacterium]|nr:2-oxoglutarate dehydrogenase E1 component [Verrucomicrobiae bacterium]